VRVRDALADRSHNQGVGANDVGKRRVLVCGVARYSVRIVGGNAKLCKEKRRKTKNGFGFGF
jgi:hypothetical protein